MDSGIQGVKGSSEMKKKRILNIEGKKQKKHIMRNKIIIDVHRHMVIKGTVQGDCIRGARKSCSMMYRKTNNVEISNKDFFLIPLRLAPYALRHGRIDTLPEACRGESNHSL